MASLVLYGLKSCDSCRKALEWLSDRDAPVEFLDIRKSGPDAALLERIAGDVGWPRLLNRRGTTWRSLETADKALAEQGREIELVTTYPALIKRPVIVAGDAFVVGFDASAIRRLEALIG